ncbi:uncharacterized protein C18orf63-like [Cyprinodon tularosa]|uniref:uncharacterized protein C18orf63-like n=1 Tax=Cyprinodon tularosa TaxID=77115 RepID=UPI0018E279F8|nr:uncharacterized protein C18orf63-like [Cyprinodon tularosa]
MSRSGSKSLFFLGLPDLDQLVCVRLSQSPDEEEELRSNQIRICRELVLLHSDILACPALDSISDITAVTTFQFLQSDFLQAFVFRNRLQPGCPQRVYPGDVQSALSYSLIARLAPSWNKAGLYLIAGEDFLMERGRLSAVSMELSTSEGRLCLSIEAGAVRMPPPTLEDFQLPAAVLRRFCWDPEAVLNPSSTGGPTWCHVLPSMKKGQIITISRQLPRDGPFRTYRDLQNHWNRLYGYRLPQLQEEEVVYCSVYFRPVGERLFTYPLSCIRLLPVQQCPHVDLQVALSHFLSDIRERLQTVCGFPARLTSKPSYHTVSLNTAASIQVLSGEQLNLTASISLSSVVTRFPAAPLSQPVISCSSRQDPPPWISFSQGGGALNAQRPLSQPSNSQNLFGSVSSFFQHFQPASSLPSLPPPAPLNPTPKLVPIFRNKDASRHVNVVQLRAQKQEQLSGRKEEKRRITLPVPLEPAANAVSFSPSLSALSVPLTPLIVPRFRPKTQRSIPSEPSYPPTITRITSLSPVSRIKPAIIVPSLIKHKAKKSESVVPEGDTVSDSRRITEQKVGSKSCVPKSIVKANRAAGPETEPDQRPLMPAGSSSKARKKKVAFGLKEEKMKASVDDVEKMNQSNQLSKLSSSTLLLWLKRRGVQVSAKHRKDELIRTVMSCLAEA